MKTLLLALSLLLTVACIGVAEPSPAAAGSHVSRADAIALLRREGILWGRSRVASAGWHSDIQEWLIVLRHPRGGQSWWLVDAAGQNYQGGTCTQ